MNSTLRIQRPRRRRGSAIVESTICFLGFVFLSLGLMEFAMAVYAYNFCSYAARDAARYASVHSADSETPATADTVRDFVRNQAVALTRDRVIVNTTWNPDNHAGSEVSVQVSYTVIPLVNLALRNNLSVSSTSRWRIGY
jgi:Flp pilus assembly protein TadG